jgi:hypothetical protein
MWSVSYFKTQSAGEYNIIKDKTEYDIVYNHREYKDFLEKKQYTYILIDLQYAQLLLVGCLYGKMLFCVLFLSHQVLNSIILSTRIGPISNTSNSSWGPK